MFRRFIDESEIEDWFEEEKTKLNKVFYDASYNKKNVEKAKKTFNEKFSQLLKRYEKEFQNLTKRIERKERLRKPFVACKDWWKYKSKVMAKSYSEHKEARKKKKLDKEYKKLMKK